MIALKIDQPENIYPLPLCIPWLSLVKLLSSRQEVTSSVLLFITCVVKEDDG